MKGQQKKEKTKDVEKAEETQARQQPAAGEKDSDVPHVPAGLVSGSLETISSMILEKMEDPESSSDLMENSLDQIEPEIEAEAIKPLMCTDLDEKDADNNQHLENEKLKMTAAESEAEAIEQLMDVYLEETEDNMEKHLATYRN
ncbi:hypothetical protein AOLI_G00133770 [Acnodon oligacanthus]